MERTDVLDEVIQEVLEHIDLWGQPIPVSLVFKLRKAWNAKMGIDDLCVCGHEKYLHCALAAPFDGAETACANGGCTCNEFRDSKG